MRILYRVLATVLIGWLAAPAQAQIVERPIPGDPVQTDAGKVSGLILPSGVKAYLGLPFAAPPVRELRWRAPQAVKPWQGVFHADRKAPECIQVLRAHNINHYFGEEATSEDCLYLNIWAPATAKPGSRLPVIVYLYGGGNTIGSSGMALYGGEQVAASGAVFVNFNYRVGALGFMAHPQLTAESLNTARAITLTSIRLQHCNGCIATLPASAETHRRWSSRVSRPARIPSRCCRPHRWHAVCSVACWV